MKKLFNLTLTAALLCGLSLTVASCSDDDDDNSSDNGGAGSDTEVMNDEHTAEAIRAWRWVSVMTDAETQDDDWEDTIYTVTIGVEGSTNTERVVYVSDLDEAKAHFAAIAGCTPDYLSTARRFDAGEFGTMDWQLSAAGAENIATVDISSPLFRSFNRLTYCNESQGADNASNITGNGYYRLGDVIEDSEGYYWVCVQPSFLGKKANESHWVNIFNAAESGRGEYTKKLPGIPKQNIKSTWDKKYNGNTILLPTSLKLDRKQNYNLTNLIWALLDPARYKQAVGTDGKGLCNFDYKYHGENYLNNVAFFWNNHDIWQKLFNRTHEQMKQMKTLNFFYNGYHWKVGSTAGVWLYTSDGYQMIYTGSDDDDDTLYEMKKEGYGFDINRYASGSFPDEKITYAKDKYRAPRKQFTEDEGYWVMRVATGKQLDKKYNHYTNMTNVSDTYRYNKDTGDMVGDKQTVKEDSQIKQKEHGAFAIGDIIRDENNDFWMCVAGWINMEGVAKSKEKKAHFICFDGFKYTSHNLNGTRQTNADPVDGKLGKIITSEDLLPEEMAPYVLSFLMEAATVPSSTIYNVSQDFRNNVEIYYQPINLNSYCCFRDTVDAKGSPASVYAMNIIYEPRDGMALDGQPYMRLVWDGTNISGKRVGNGDANWYLHFFKNYNQKGGQTMDLVHLWSKSSFITKDNPIKADNWSRCKHADSDERDGDFTYINRYSDNDFTTKQWLDYPDEYVSAYHEPVLAVRYMALDDVSDSILSTYNGKKFTKVYVVDKTVRTTNITSLINLASRLHHTPKEPWVVMDEQPFNDNPLLKESMIWE